MESGSFLLIGQDTNTTSWVENAYPFVSGRMARTWGFMQTGVAGPVRFSFRMQDLPNVSNLGVIVSESEAFDVNQSVQFYPLTIAGDSAHIDLTLPTRGVFTVGQLPELGVSDQVSRHPKMYPNPAQDELNIQFPIAYHESWQWRFFDSAGKQVASGRSSSAQSSVSVADWTSGLYIVEIRSQHGEVFRERVIIQH